MANKLQTMSTIGQFMTGLADKQEGTIYSLLNFIKDFKAAKRLQLGQENVGARRVKRSRGEPWRDIPIMPTDSEVNNRVTMDLLPFVRDLLPKPPSGHRSPEMSQSVNWG